MDKIHLLVKVMYCDGKLQNSYLMDCASAHSQVYYRHIIKTTFGNDVTVAASYH